MNQRLSKSDFLFVYMMILSLSLFVAGFFLGGSVVKRQMESKLEEYAANHAVQSESNQNLYPHSDFINFYDNVFLPVQSFQNEHFQLIHQMNADDRSLDIQHISTNLKKLATQTEEILQKSYVSDASPLLQQSLEQYKLGLSSYKKSFESLYEHNLKGQPSIQLLEATAGHQYQEYFLNAQKAFYQAILEWEKIYENRPATTVANIVDAYGFSLNEWNKLSLHEKNYILSQLLLDLKRPLPFQPEDITVHIDALVYSGSANKLGIDRLGKALEILIATNSVNAGDFLKDKELYYPELSAPLIPLFSNHQ